MNCPALNEKLEIRSSNINVLKFICAIAVIIGHQSYIYAGKEDVLSQLSHGQCGIGGIAVAVFFFLSGLYVSKSLDKSDSYISFLKKRCIRIFPQLWLTVLVTVLLGLFITALSLKEYILDVRTYKYFINGLLIPIHDLPGVFDDLPFKTVNGSLWSLPVEFAAYVCLVVIAKVSTLLFGNNKTGRRVLDLIAFGSVSAVLLSFYYLLGGGRVAFIALRPFLIFFEGVIFYDLRNRIRLIPALGLASIALCGLMSLTPFFNLGIILFLPYGILSLALGMPQTRFDSSLFKISYEMYLVGWPIQQAVRQYFSDDLNIFICCVLAIIIDMVVGKVIYSLSYPFQTPVRINRNNASY